MGFHCRQCSKEGDRERETEREEILEEMKRILSAMADSESFQEIINDFLEVKSKTAEIKGGIKDRINPDDGIFDGDDDDIFDK